ncbi:MAG: cupredoxin domain-containing protein [Corynebacterium sp.]|nr:cupredoxin domain-containing protein [Corynebacterium sp.]
MPANTTATNSSSPAASDGSRQSRLRKNAWHRKASRPVTIWMIIFVICTALYPVFPDYRWLLIHLFTLGALTNSIMLWSQSLTEKFLHQPLAEETRIWQVRRFWILNFGIALVIIGQLLERVWEYNWTITCTGSLIVGLSLLYHAIYLGRQYLHADRTQRFAPAVLAYIASATFLPLGAIGGSIMSIYPRGMWHDRIVLAHMICNVLGFVGCAAVGSLSLLFPAVWRTQAPKTPIRLELVLMIAGVLTAALGALIDAPDLLAFGLGTYLLAILLAAWQWAQCITNVLKDPRDRITFSSLAVAAAPLWLIGGISSVIWSAIDTNTVATIELPSLHFVIGFAGQLLIGVMSYLLPSNIGGGPAATRTGLLMYDRAGILRSTLFNLGMLVWMFSTNNTLNLIVAVLTIGSLGVFLLLTPFAVRAQLGVIRKQREPATAPQHPAWWQAIGGVAIIVAVMFGTGGMASGSMPGFTSTDDVTTVEIEAGDMKFTPADVSVPRGTKLRLVIHNVDDMAHDLHIEIGANTKRVAPGDTVELDVGQIDKDLDGWCTIAGHRSKGMEFHIRVT